MDINSTLSKFNLMCAGLKSTGLRQFSDTEQPFIGHTAPRYHHGDHEHELRGHPKRTLSHQLWLFQKTKC